MLLTSSVGGFNVVADFMVWFHLRTRYYLGDANAVDPLLEASDIVTAQILDVLRLFLDLRVLHTQIHTNYYDIEIFLTSSSRHDSLSEPVFIFYNQNDINPVIMLTSMTLYVFILPCVCFVIKKRCVMTFCLTTVGPYGIKVPQIKQQLCTTLT